MSLSTPADLQPSLYEQLRCQLTATRPDLAGNPTALDELTIQCLMEAFTRRVAQPGDLGNHLAPGLPLPAPAPVMMSPSPLLPNETITITDGDGSTSGSGGAGSGSAEESDESAVLLIE
ncbi:unnamed protein product [Protopolystoma xenopodis]|uniref:Uncharacterized protein n=1 Tax=Protopolystoma xenopodis TaxID=117903 RepID=A0A448X035_9PLAT|nr:unnamed protein product [Protopolystoma xenopodis]